MTPTQRALKSYRQRDYTCQVVERWNSFARIRQDLFGCIDLVCVSSSRLVGVQATSLSNVAARRRKCEQEPRLKLWLSVAEFEIVGYGEKGGALVERTDWATKNKIGDITWYSTQKTIGKVRSRVGKAEKRKQ